MSWLSLEFPDDTGLVGGDHVFDVDERIWPASLLQQFQSFLLRRWEDEVTQLATGQLPEWDLQHSRCASDDSLYRLRCSLETKLQSAHL